MENLKSATLTGGSFERGKQHGEMFADRIRNNVDIYFHRFEKQGIPQADATEKALDFLSIIEGAKPEYVAEMEGIAEGSDVPMEHVALMNVRYEVMYSDFAQQTGGDSNSPADASPDGCTTFGVAPSITCDGRTYIGQNWDWIAPIAANLVITDVRRDERPNAVGITEAGLATIRKGVNEHGIGFVTNGLVTPGDGENNERKPYMVRCREIQDAERLDEAIGAVVGESRACSTNFLIGHANGEMIDIEAAPETANYLYPTDGYLTHTNHFENRQKVESKFERVIPHSLVRKPRMERLFSRCSGDVDDETLKEIFRDHFNYPASICHHVDENLPEPKQLQTISSVIIDLTNRRMLATSGPPCENNYHEFTIESFAK
jgi:isopenicillin-N N-acyltransferase-like protein